MKFYKKITCLLISMLISSNIVFAGMLDGKKIVLDAGHGGKDPGAVYGGFKEKDINMDIIIKTFNILKKFGAEIILTRNDDEYVSLQDRVKKANESQADLFISVHNNVSAYEKDGQVIINSAVNGTEVYYSSSRPNIKIQKYVEYNGSRYEYVKEEKLMELIMFIY
ncbi:N-acetylmuramoyl-L-alanine amidase [Caloramator sp.]|uniref:N-acetylmuramoyl-L-alanine amidase family protein n=1 Tax=Caloramator sp. TaxID=1871330 RepID=UPI0025C39181|nr:N-acetylmuramoyl-L-alanine amidase [Caloramator sp.]